MIESKHINYSKGFKYQLNKPAYFKVKIYGVGCRWKWISLNKDGLVRIEAGYAWDGASGPTIDTKSSMRGSLIHDALYQLMRRGLLEHNGLTRKVADKKLEECCLADGMWKWRALGWFRAVRKFAGMAAHPKNKRKEYIAP